MDLRGKRVLLIGDSLSVATPGTPGWDLGERLVTRNGASAVRINAKGGRSARNFFKSEKGSAQLQEYRGAVDAALVMLGTNDAASGNGVEFFQRLDEELRRLGISAVFIGPPSFAPDARGGGGKGLLMQEAAQKLSILLRGAFPGRFLDAMPLSADLVAPPFRRADRIHFTPPPKPEPGEKSGAAIFADRLSDALLSFSAENGAPASTAKPIAFGRYVSEAFAEKVRAISSRLGFDPDWLMSVMYHESARSFSPSKRNPGSKATGLIQFVGSTAAGLLGLPKTKEGREEALARMAAMSDLEQLDYVEKFLSPYKGRLRSLDDVASAVFAGHLLRPGERVFLRDTKAYEANPNTDKDKDGAIEAEEIWAPYRAAYKLGTGREYAPPRQGGGGGAGALLVLTGLGLAFAKWKGVL